MKTQHAKVRLQQRCIPLIVNQWLDEFGEEVFDGHGGVYISFTHQSIRTMEQAFGRHFVRQNWKYLNVYRIESVDNSTVITVGWRTRRIIRH